MSSLNCIGATLQAFSERQRVLLSHFFLNRFLESRRIHKRDVRLLAFEQLPDREDLDFRIFAVQRLVEAGSTPGSSIEPAVFARLLAQFPPRRDCSMPAAQAIKAAHRISAVTKSKRTNAIRCGLVGCVPKIMR